MTVPSIELLTTVTVHESIRTKSVMNKYTDHLLNIDLISQNGCENKIRIMAQNNDSFTTCYQV